MWTTNSTRSMKNTVFSNWWVVFSCRHTWAFTSAEKRGSCFCMWTLYSVAIVNPLTGFGFLCDPPLRPPSLGFPSPPAVYFPEGQFSLRSLAETSGCKPAVLARPPVSLDVLSLEAMPPSFSPSLKRVKGGFHTSSHPGCSGSSFKLCNLPHHQD